MMMDKEILYHVMGGRCVQISFMNSSICECAEGVGQLERNRGCDEWKMPAGT